MIWVQEEVRSTRARAGSTSSRARSSRRCRDCATSRVGMANVFIQPHVGLAVAERERAPDVRRDFESWFNRAVPEDAPYWTHTREGPDDMPAHIKASLLGPSLTLPVRDGSFASARGRGSTSASTAIRAGRGGGRDRVGRGPRLTAVRPVCEHVFACDGTS